MKNFLLAAPSHLKPQNPVPSRQNVLLQTENNQNDFISERQVKLDVDPFTNQNKSELLEDKPLMKGIVSNENNLKDPKKRVRTREEDGLMPLNYIKEVLLQHQPKLPPVEKPQIEKNDGSDYQDEIEQQECKPCIPKIMNPPTMLPIRELDENKSEITIEKNKQPISLQYIKSKQDIFNYSNRDQKKSTSEEEEEEMIEQREQVKNTEKKLHSPISQIENDVISFGQFNQNNNNSNKTSSQENAIDSNKTGLILKSNFSASVDQKEERSVGIHEKDMFTENQQTPAQINVKGNQFNLETIKIEDKPLPSKPNITIPNGQNSIAALFASRKVRKREDTPMQQLFIKLGFKDRQDFLKKEFEHILKRNNRIELTAGFLINQMSCGKLCNSERVLLVERANQQLRSDLDVCKIIQRLKELEKFKELFLTSDQQTLFNFFPKPIISMEEEQKDTISRENIMKNMKDNQEKPAVIKTKKQRRITIQPMNKLKLSALATRVAGRIKALTLHDTMTFTEVSAFEKLYLSFQKVNSLDNNQQAFEL